jgi:hypothetical protein
VHAEILDPGRSGGIIALVFRCRIVGGEPGATSEADEVTWLTRIRCGS